MDKRLPKLVEALLDRGHGTREIARMLGVRASGVSYWRRVLGRQGNATVELDAEALINLLPEPLRTECLETRAMNLLRAKRRGTPEPSR